MMLRRISIVTASLVSAVTLTACATPKAEPTPAPPPQVDVLDVVEETVPLPSEWIATLDGYANAQVRPQVSGYLLRRRYQEGSVVRKGDVLFEIDPRPFEAALEQALAQQAQAEAQFARAARDVERDTPLATEKAIAQGQLDTEVHGMNAAHAGVDAAKAAVHTAELNLGFTRVTSLIDGVAGIASAQIGDLVGPATLLTTVSQIEPIKAYFPVSEQEYLAIADRINSPRGRGQPWDETAGLSLILSDGHLYPATGRFVAVDREVDPKTGTIRIAATFANPGRVLRPGQYGRVRAVTKHLTHAIVVPERAISELQGHYQVHLVGSDNKVQLRSVTVGDRMAAEWIVTTGLQPGDRVAVDGAQFLPPGTVVSPKPFASAKTE